MDMSGASPEEKAAAAGFLGEQAEEDRKTTKAKAADDGLTRAKKAAQNILKGIAHAEASDSDEVRLLTLKECADLGNDIRDACDGAARKMAKEDRNGQF